MREITATITQRGQVTIPAAVRRALGVQPRDKVTFCFEGDQVRLTPAAFTLESAYGSVRPSQKPEDFKRISRSAKEGKAAQTIRTLRVLTESLPPGKDQP